MILFPLSNAITSKLFTCQIGAVDRGTLWIKDISIEWIIKAYTTGRGKGEKRKVEGIPLKNAFQFYRLIR